MKLTKETNLYRDHAVKNGVDDAAKVATNYLDYDQQTGLTLGYINTNERAVITGNGMELYDGSNNQIAQFKDVTRLGLATEGHLQMDYHSFQLKDMDGNTYVYFSDTRDHSRYTVIEETEVVATTSIGSYEHKFVYPISEASDLLELKINGVERTEEIYFSTNWEGMYTGIVLRTEKPIEGDSVYLKYKTDIPIRAFTLGTRDLNSYLGLDSFVNGTECIASGDQSHASGWHCQATGQFAHAFGRGCIASGSFGAYACGYENEANGQSSVALGRYCVSNGSCACAIGESCQATKGNSVAIGNNCIADGYHQCVLGTYNVSNSSLLFLIGCGTSSQRKNAVSVDNSGNMTIAGTLTQSSDKRLKHHRAYLSDQQDQVTEFINRLKPAWFEKDEQKHLGFYAQDIRQTDRWQCMVDNDTNGYLTLGYTELLAPLVAYCQNLEQKVEILEQRIERLEQLLNQ